MDKATDALERLEKTFHALMTNPAKPEIFGIPAIDFETIRAALTAAPLPEADESPRSRALSWASKAGATPPEEAAAIYKTYREMKDASAPPGFVLVPREPTNAMTLAGAKQLKQFMELHTHNADRIYKAMLAAAPSPPHENEIERLTAENNRLADLIGHIYLHVTTDSDFNAEELLRDIEASASGSRTFDELTGALKIIEELKAIQKKDQP